MPRLTKLPWIPSEEQWLRILEVARREPVRNRVMLTLAYDAALRREELCSLRTDDVDPAHRTLRIRAETTKNRLERVVPYSAPTGVLLSDYLAHRATISRARGPLLHSPPTPHRRRAMLDVIALLLTHSAQTGRSYWGWDTQEWTRLLGRTQAEFRQHAPAWAGDEVRPYLAAHAYLLGSFNEFHQLGSFQRLTLSWRIFGRDRVTIEIARVRTVLGAWGYQLGQADDTLLPSVTCQLSLFNRSPHLEDMDTALFDRVRRERLLEGAQLHTLHALQTAVAALGFCDPPLPSTGRHSARATGGAKIWEQWADRWHDTSTLTPRVRGSVRSTLLRVGRWIAAEQPAAADPTDWTWQTCATWIAALDRMKVGDYVQRTAGLKDRLGKPLEAPTKAGQITALRTFFRDCQEWEWLPRRFDPLRALAIPRSITALLGPDPTSIPRIFRRPGPGTSTPSSWSARSR
ncbi:site-specific integrase [Streptomyces sp. 6N106]|uniref:site-specific integrase n=1 Tax=Streptomyces sp. 6N106 TaxID=3457418 RepID=UPI003FD06192